MLGLGLQLRSTGSASANMPAKKTAQGCGARQTSPARAAEPRAAVVRITMRSSSESISYWVLAAPVQERSSCCDVRTSRANYTEATAAGLA